MNSESTSKFIVKKVIEQNENDRDLSRKIIKGLIADKWRLFLCGWMTVGGINLAISPDVETWSAAAGAMVAAAGVVMYRHETRPWRKALKHLD